MKPFKQVCKNIAGLFPCYIKAYFYTLLLLLYIAKPVPTNANPPKINSSAAVLSATLIQPLPAGVLMHSCAILQTYLFGRFPFIANFQLTNSQKLNSSLVENQPFLMGKFKDSIKESKKFLKG